MPPTRKTKSGKAAATKRDAGPKPSGKGTQRRRDEKGEREEKGESAATERREERRERRHPRGKDDEHRSHGSEYDCSDLMDLKHKNRENREHRRKHRGDRPRDPLARMHPMLFISTFGDPAGDRRPGDALSVANELRADAEEYPSVVVHNAGHLPAYGTIVEFLLLPRDAARTLANVKRLAAVVAPSVPPRGTRAVVSPKALPKAAERHILLARAWSAADPPLDPLDWGDPHLGQACVGWRSRYDGDVVRSTADPSDAAWNGGTFTMRVECQESGYGPAAGVRVRVFAETGGRGQLPTTPQQDVQMASVAATVQFMAADSIGSTEITIDYLDHDRLRFHEKRHFTDGSGRPDYFLDGILVAT